MVHINFRNGREAGIKEEMWRYSAFRVWSTKGTGTRANRVKGNRLIVQGEKRSRSGNQDSDSGIAKTIRARNKRELVHIACVYHEFATSEVVLGWSMGYNNNKYSHSGVPEKKVQWWIRFLQSARKEKNSKKQHGRLKMVKIIGSSLICLTLSSPIDESFFVPGLQGLNIQRENHYKQRAKKKQRTGAKPNKNATERRAFFIKWKGEKQEPRACNIKGQKEK
jgi:hypothetical protein